ncbi:hypothetical protein ANO11243_073550 [Dothideomycetidae sp. 11243]|nr:hypothetical protein ANO11243_073550 [fungal sp. No.11243]
MGHFALLFLSLWSLLSINSCNASPTCSSTNPSIVRLQNDIADPVSFCTFWRKSPTARAHSPFIDLSANAVAQACSCIVVDPVLISQTATEPLPTGTGGHVVQCLPNDSALLAFKDGLRQPAAFCKFWQNDEKMRVNSPFTQLTPNQISSICSCASQDPSLLSKAHTLGTHTIQSTTARHSKGKVSKSHHSTTHAPGATPSANSAAHTFSPVRVPASSTIAAKLVVPSGINRLSPKNLIPAKGQQLAFQASTGNSTDIAASSNVTYKYPSVMLDYSAFVSSVSCAGSSISIVFNDKSSLVKSNTDWSKESPLLLITSTSPCSSDGSSYMFLATSITKSGSSTLIAKGSKTTLKDALKTYSLSFGPGPSDDDTTTVTDECGTLDANGDGPTITCGPYFNMALNDKAGYYDLDNVGSVMVDIGAPAPTQAAKIAGVVERPGGHPNPPNTAAMAASAAAGAALVSVAMQYWNGQITYNFGFPPVLSTTARGGIAVTQSINSAPSVTPVSSPWGQQAQIYNYADTSNSNDPFFQQAQQLQSSGGLLGTSPIQQGMQVYCVNCSLNAGYSYSGSYNSALMLMSVDLVSNTNFNFMVGVNAFSPGPATADMSLGDFSLTPISFGNLLTITPVMHVEMTLGLMATSPGQMFFGVQSSEQSLDIKLTKPIGQGLNQVTSPNQLDSYPVNAYGGPAGDFSMSIRATLELQYTTNSAYGSISYQDFRSLEAKSLPSDASCNGTKYAMTLQTLETVFDGRTSVNVQNGNYQPPVYNTCVPSKMVAKVSQTTTVSSSSTTIASSSLSTTTTSLSSTTSMRSSTTLSTGTTTQSSSTATTSLSASSTPCVQGNYTMTTSDGQLWQLSDTQDYQAGFYTSTAVSMLDCVQQCDRYTATPCFAAVWVKSGQAQQFCYLNGPTTASANHMFPAGIVATSAIRINGTSCLSTVSPTCPQADGTYYRDTSGVSYGIKCGYDYGGNDISSNTTRTSLSDCMSYCDSVSGCVGVTWVYGGTQKSPVCYAKSARNSQATANSTYTYRVDSAWLANAMSKRSSESEEDLRLRERGSSTSSSTTSSQNLTVITIPYQISQSLNTFYLQADTTGNLVLTPNPASLDSSFQFQWTKNLITSTSSGMLLLYAKSQNHPSSIGLYRVYTSTDSQGYFDVPKNSTLFQMAQARPKPTDPPMLAAHSPRDGLLPIVICTYKTSSPLKYKMFLWNPAVTPSLTLDLLNSATWQAEVVGGIVSGCSVQYLSAPGMGSGV